MKSPCSAVILAVLFLLAFPLMAQIVPTPGSHSIIITQIYVAGGNTGTPASTYNVGYMELFNAGPVPVDLTDWTLQYQTATGSLGPSNTYLIGPNSAYSASSIDFPAQATFAYNNPNFHGILQPGQYLLVAFAGQGGQNSPWTPTTAPMNLPLTPDVILWTTINCKTVAGTPGGVCADLGLTTPGGAGKPSNSGGKWGVVPSLTTINCGVNSSNPAQSNPTTDPYYVALGPYASDFVGYRSDSGTTPNCYEGTGPAYTKPTSGSKNVVAAMRNVVNGCPVDTNNNGSTDGTTFSFADLPMVAIGSTNWSLHNSDSVVTGSSSTPTSYTPVSCWAGQSTIMPTVEALIAAPLDELPPVTPPALPQYPNFTPITEIEAKPEGNPTPIAITVTVTDGGVNPTSAVGYQITADLSQIPAGAIVESFSTPSQKFGFLDLDPDFHNPRYQFPIPPQNPPPTTPPKRGTLTINPPVADIGKTYTIPVTVVDDALRVTTTSVSIKVAGSTPGKANVAANPVSVPADIPTDVLLTAAITDPGAYPAATSYTVTMDLTSIGGGSAVNCPSTSTSVYTCTATITPPLALAGTSYTIPVTVVDDQGRTLSLTPSSIQIAVTAQAEPVALLAWAAPNAGSFGGVTQGTTSAAQTATLTNTGLAALSISGIGSSGDFHATNDCPASLSPSASCSIVVTFTPTTLGTLSGALTVTDDSNLQPGSQQSLPLTGVGLASPATAELSKASLSFGNQIVTTAAAAQTVTLANNGGLPLSINGINLAGDSDFTYTTTCRASLASGASCDFTVTFKPATAGNKAATLTVNDNAAGGPHTVQFTGAGVDFPIAPVANGSMTATINAGQTATYNLQITPAGPFNGTVTIACSSVIQGAVCTANPASININGAAVPFALSISTTARNSQTAGMQMPPSFFANLSGPGASGTSMPISLAGMTILSAGLLFASSRKARQQWRAGVLCVALLCVAGLSGCADLKKTDWPQQPAVSTPAGTYTVTVTATYGAVVRTTNLTLTVN